MGKNLGPGNLRIQAGGLTVASLAYADASSAVPAALKNRFATAGVKEEDLLHLHYPLVHEGANLNGDIFLAAEMQASYETLVGTVLDKDHSQGIDQIVGRHYKAEYATENSKGVIYCDAYIYANLYPDVALKLEDGAIDGVSMETYFKWAERVSEGRILHGLTFVGAGLVRMPADPLARVTLEANRAAASLEDLIYEELMALKGSR